MTITTPQTNTDNADEPWAFSLNHVKWLRGLLTLAQITEAEFLAFMQATQAWDVSLRSLEIVAAVAPAKLQAAYDDWPELLMQFNQQSPGDQK